MITNRELAVIRAALKFWEEEMAPFGPEACKWYFEGEVPENMSPKEVANLRRQLKNSKLRYGLIDHASASLANMTLYTIEEVGDLIHSSKQEQFASVLIIDGTV